MFYFNANILCKNILTHEKYYLKRVEELWEEFDEIPSGTESKDIEEDLDDVDLENGDPNSNIDDHNHENHRKNGKEVI